jgi:hypothetical protein
MTSNQAISVVQRPTEAHNQEKSEAMQNQFVSNLFRGSVADESKL